MSLATPIETVETLQTSLQTKAKTEPAFRFYSLWDKICREDVLLDAYCRCRENAGAAGVDGETFGRMEAQGQERWLKTLREELVTGRYAPKPLLRVWIPKSNGGQRPLGIPTIRDRVVQMAAVLILSPIFEADLLPQQYGFRPGVDAKISAKSVLARDAARETRSGGRRLTRLLHFDSACSLDAESGTAHRRRTFIAHDQALADSVGCGARQRPPGSDCRSMQ
jgi:RNA-directed DNA polymerase